MSVLDIECLDRIYLNAYVPILQSSGQVVAFLTQHLELPVPSPALLEKIGHEFRTRWSPMRRGNEIPWVRFGKGERKIDVMQPYLHRQAGDRAVRGGRDRGGAGVPAGAGPLTSATRRRRLRSTRSRRPTAG